MRCVRLGLGVGADCCVAQLGQHQLQQVASVPIPNLTKEPTRVHMDALVNGSQNIHRIVMTYSLRVIGLEICGLLR